MALFLVLSLGHFEEEIQAAIEKNFPNRFYDLGDSRWFVVSDSPTTAKRISNKLGITRPNSKTGMEGVVVSVNGYFGLADAELWEWLATATGNGNG